jgi:hypothetical protein
MISMGTGADRTPPNSRLLVKEPQECMTKGRMGKRKKGSLEGLFKSQRSKFEVVEKHWTTIGMLPLSLLKGDERNEL